MVALRPILLKLTDYSESAEIITPSGVPAGKVNMGDIVNLNQYRKQRERLERKKAAAANRVKFGRRKHETVQEKRERKRKREELDRKLLDGRAKPGDTPEAS